METPPQIANTEPTGDLLLEETVADLREVFDLDHVFPVVWSQDGTEKKDPPRKRLRDWFRRVFGFRKDSAKAC